MKLAIGILLIIVVLFIIIVLPIGLYQNIKFYQKKKQIISEVTSIIGEHKIISSSGLFDDLKVNSSGFLLVLAQGELVMLEIEKDTVSSFQKCAFYNN